MNRNRSSYLAALLLAIMPAAFAVDDQALFADNCASCHGLDGKARTPAGKKLHAHDLSLSQLTDAGIAQQVREGKKDEHGKFTMPPFKEKFSEEEIVALIAVVKGLRK